jgi:hypothetical protein
VANQPVTPATDRHCWEKKTHSPFAVLSVNCLSADVNDMIYDAMMYWMAVNLQIHLAPTRKRKRSPICKRKTESRVSMHMPPGPEQEESMGSIKAWKGQGAT